MNILLAAISERPSVAPFAGLVETYVQRTCPFIKVELRSFRTERALLEVALRQKTRVPALLVLLDSRGRQLNSEQMASWIGAQRDRGQQQLIFAVGPANGWSDFARERAGLLLSLGPMTLPHELARVVVAEQVYRAFTILAGHPYHAGH